MLNASKVVILIHLILFSFGCFSQNTKLSMEASTSSFLIPSDSLNRPRLKTLAWTGAATYGIVLVGLNEAWYKDYERVGFHFFDDGGEWKNMDKWGHLFTAYFESEWIYGLSKWSGVNDRSSIWIGAGMASAFQLTVEILDAHSAEWGFSWKDVAANTGGAALFALQQSLWKEQRIRVKFSAHPVDHSRSPIFSADGSSTSSAHRRAEEVFGSNGAQALLKDYNGQTYWLSINPYSFTGKSPESHWQALNIALGIGAENMYGGYGNSWSEEGQRYRIEDSRVHQYYLSLDVDWSRIRTNKPWVRVLLNTLNVIKLPFPALEYASSGKMKFHPLYF